VSISLFLFFFTFEDPLTRN